MSSCFIALGSNLGDRKKNIELALEFLKRDPAIKICKISSLFETEPQGGAPQPKFLNGAAKLETSYSAQELLKKLQAIEVKLGRKAPHPKNHPRSIDLDILLYGDVKINEEDLQVPHPRMWERSFVTVPLKEIAPEIVQ